MCFLSTTGITNLFFLVLSQIIRCHMAYKVQPKYIPYCQSSGPSFHTHYYHLRPIRIFPPRPKAKRLSPFYFWI